MKKILIACRFGVGTSLILKIKIQEVIKEHNLPIIVEHSNLDGIAGFRGDAIFTVIDVASEMSEKYPNIDFYGIANIIDKDEIYSKICEFMSKHE